MDRGMSYIEEGQEKISHGVNVKDMMEIEAGNKFIEFGRQKQAMLVRDSVTYLRKEIKLRMGFSNSPRTRNLNHELHAFS